MHRRHRSLLARVFQQPTSGDIRFQDIEHLLVALGADVVEGSGSRVRFALNGRRAVFHRPHPSGIMKKGAVRAMKQFLIEAGVGP